jgi:hypothetical protein
MHGKAAIGNLDVSRRQSRDDVALQETVKERKDYGYDINQRRND